MSTAFMVDNILQDKEDTFSSVSEGDSDSEDHKDSICDSPSPNFRVHHHHHHPDTDDLLPAYTVLRDHRRGGGRDGAMMMQDVDLDSDDGGGSTGSELYCAKCGGNSKFIGPMDFKCDKCGCMDYVQTSVVQTTKDVQTIIAAAKDDHRPVKPVLKFSVSAILGDRKECAKVRNGEMDFFFVENVFHGVLKTPTTQLTEEKCSLEF